MSSKRYKNPPIIEALCEFQFEPNPNSAWDLVVPGLIYDELRDVFPRRSPGGLFASSSLGSSRTQYRISDGIRFLSEDGKTVVLLGEDLLSINRLRPYSSWDEFLPLIKRGFEAYSNVVKPEDLRGIELRYINDIEVPGKYSDLEAYFNIRPTTGPDLARDVGAFISGVQVPYENSRDKLRIELTGFDSDEAGTTSTTLDLTYYLAEVEELELRQVFQWVEAAHARIEQVFESSVTKATKQMFEEVNR